MTHDRSDKDKGGIAVYRGIMRRELQARRPTHGAARL